MTTGVLVGALVLAPAASAAGTHGSITTLALFGLPSLHSIIEGIAKGFFSALAGALVPGFLKHGTVATIQHLVALPDPAGWTHVGQLQEDMVYLGASLLPVTLAVGTLRYWMLGFTGSAHPASAIGRCTAATGVLVAYRWIVEEAVAATNTLTHAILAFPAVGDGLTRIISVLFGGALLTGAGGVFGAFLVIVGVLFAAGLFALQVLLTVVLALLIVAGPPLISLSAIPELSHLARAWAHALLVVALVPLAWTVLFATAGALCLDATSFTGGAGGLPGHVAAAFAGLITFVIAVKLPLMLLGELRHSLGAASFRSNGGNGASGQGSMPGAERVRAAHARLRSVAFDAVPSLGRSAGRAAGAMGAPAGGSIGAASRGLAGAARRSGITPGMMAAAGVAGSAGAGAGAAVGRRGSASGGRGGVRERLARAGTIIAKAPRDAGAAMSAGSRKQTGGPARAAAAGRIPDRGGRNTTGTPGKSPSSATGKTPANVGAIRAQAGQSAMRPQGNRPRPAGAPSPVQAKPAARAKPRSAPASVSRVPAPKAASGKPGAAHPGRKVTASAQREAAAPAKSGGAAGKAGGGQRSRPREPRTKPTGPSPASGAQRAKQRPLAGRRPQPRPRPQS